MESSFAGNVARNFTSEIESLRRELRDSRQEVTKLRTLYEKTSHRADTVSADAISAKKQLTALQTESSRLSRENNILKAAKDTIQTSLNEKNAYIKKLEASLTAGNRGNFLLEQNTKFLETIESLKGDLEQKDASLSFKSRELDKALIEIEKLSSALELRTKDFCQYGTIEASLLYDVAHNRNEAAQVRVDLGELRKKYESLEFEKREADVLLTKANEDVKILTDRCAILSTDVLESHKDRERLEKRVEELEAERNTSLNFIATQSAKLSETLVRMETTDKKHAQTVQALSDTQNALRHAEQRLEQYKRMVDNSDASMSREKQALEAVRKQLGEIEVAFHRLQLEHASVLGKLTRYGDENQQLRMRISAQEQELITLRAELRTATERQVDLTSITEAERVRLESRCAELKDALAQLTLEHSTVRAERERVLERLGEVSSRCAVAEEESRQAQKNVQALQKENETLRATKFNTALALQAGADTGRHHSSSSSSFSFSALSSYPPRSSSTASATNAPAVPSSPSSPSSHLDATLTRSATSFRSPKSAAVERAEALLRSLRSPPSHQDTPKRTPGAYSSTGSAGVPASPGTPKQHATTTAVTAGSSFLMSPPLSPTSSSPLRSTISGRTTAEILEAARNRIRQRSTADGAGTGARTAVSPPQVPATAAALTRNTTKNTSASELRPRYTDEAPAQPSHRPKDSVAHAVHTPTDIPLSAHSLSHPLSYASFHAQRRNQTRSHSQTYAQPHPRQPGTATRRDRIHSRRASIHSIPSIARSQEVSFDHPILTLIEGAENAGNGRSRSERMVTQRRNQTRKDDLAPWKPPYAAPPEEMQGSPTQPRGAPTGANELHPQLASLVGQLGTWLGALSQPIQDENAEPPNRSIHQKARRQAVGQNMSAKARRTNTESPMRTKKWTKIQSDAAKKEEKELIQEGQDAIALALELASLTLPSNQESNPIASLESLSPIPLPSAESSPLVDGSPIEEMGASLSLDMLKTNEMRLSQSEQQEFPTKNAIDTSRMKLQTSIMEMAPPFPSVLENAAFKPSPSFPSSDSSVSAAQPIATIPPPTISEVNAPLTNVPSSSSSTRSKSAFRSSGKPKASRNRKDLLQVGEDAISEFLSELQGSSSTSLTPAASNATTATTAADSNQLSDGNTKEEEKNEGVVLQEGRGDRASTVFVADSKSIPSVDSSKPEDATPVSKAQTKRNSRHENGSAARFMTPPTYKPLDTEFLAALQSSIFTPPVDGKASGLQASSLDHNTDGISPTDPGSTETNAVGDGNATYVPTPIKEVSPIAKVKTSGVDRVLIAATPPEMKSIYDLYTPPSVTKGGEVLSGENNIYFQGLYELRSASDSQHQQEQQSGASFPGKKRFVTSATKLISASANSLSSFASRVQSLKSNLQKADAKGNSNDITSISPPTVGSVARSDTSENGFPLSTQSAMDREATNSFGPNGNEESHAYADI